MRPRPRRSATAILGPTLALLFTGCLLTPEVFEERRAFLRDDDGDGFAGDDDCDDTNPRIHPDAVEVCDSVDNNCDGSVDDRSEGVAWYADSDGDGYGDVADLVDTCTPPEGFVAEAGDCNDTNASIHPGQAESCNDVDDNCDGDIDNGAPPDGRVWHPDADEDGFGDPNISYASCAQPEAGWVLDSSDCDDTSASNRPGATELCDGIDNDCDGTEDEAPTADPLTWYADLDGDGYGRNDSPIEQCLQPASNYVLLAEDCNDANDTIYPGAPEYCNDLDDNCDGTPDDPPTTGEGTWYADVDRDGYGDPLSTESSCDPGPGKVDNGDDCDDSDRDINPDAAEVCNDRHDNNCNGSPDSCVWDSAIDMENHYTITGYCEDGEMGRAGAVGDIDGDGQDELLLGAGADCGLGSGALAGAIYTFELPITGSTDASSASHTLYGDVEYDGLGYDIVLEDFDGDGYPDLLTAEAGRELEGNEDVGHVLVLYGPLTASSMARDTADWVVQGPSDHENTDFGEPLANTGDIDADGLPDFGISSLDINEFEGSVWLFTSSSTGTDSADTAAQATLVGSEDNDQNDRLGSCIAGADFNSDGHSDWIVGASGYTEAVGASKTGALFLLHGPVTGAYTTEDADITFTSENYNSQFGHTCAGLGDINRDGYEDLMVGADQTGDGTAYIVWGSSTLGTIPIANADVIFHGDVSPNRFGYTTEAAGDLNDDGWNEVIIADAAADPNNVYVFYGPFTSTGARYASSADITFHGDGDRDGDYQALIATHDLTGDDVLDVAVGSWKHTLTGYYDGIFYIVPGTSY